MGVVCPEMADPGRSSTTPARVVETGLGRPGSCRTRAIPITEALFRGGALAHDRSASLAVWSRSPGGPSPTPARLSRPAAAFPPRAAAEPRLRRRLATTSRVAAVSRWRAGNPPQPLLALRGAAPDAPRGPAGIATISARVSPVDRPGAPRAVVRARPAGDAPLLVVDKAGQNTSRSPGGCCAAPSGQVRGGRRGVLSRSGRGEKPSAWSASQAAGSPLWPAMVLRLIVPTSGVGPASTAPS